MVYRWWCVCLLGMTHSRFNTGECSSEESALPTGSIRSILLSCFLCSSSSSSWKERKKKKKREEKSLKNCSSKVKNSPSHCHYFYLAALASPPLLPISFLWLLIQLPAGTSKGLYSKSKETFSTGASMLLQKHPSPAKLFSDCSDKVALIDGSHSINQVRLGAWHPLPDFLWRSDQVCSVV